ncbi:MAG: VapC toxin family PIN domain ribonuclease [Acidimicrobiia bacterium]
MTFVVDASVAIEVLLRTPRGDRALDLIGDTPVAAPELLDAEVLSVLRRLTLRGALAPRRARQAIAALTEWPILRLSHSPLLPATFALRENLSAYDALYVAAAAALNAVIVTADGPLARAPVPVAVHDVG